MTAVKADPIAQFVTAWTDEFIKSVAMFTGVTVTVEPSSAAHPSEVRGAEFAWLAQTFERTGSGEIWIGVPTTACAELVAGAADGDAASQAAMFQELLRQSLQGAAHVLNTGGFSGFRCSETFHTDPPPATLEWRTLHLVMANGTRVPLLISAADSFAELLARAPEAPAQSPEVAGDENGYGATFDRFVGVDLPIAIVLGRATLRLRDVLKLSVGSLIELDRHVNDPVEVCVHDAVVARGEVVSIRGNYGVRVREVLTHRERMQIRGVAPRNPGAGDRPQIH